MPAFHAALFRASRPAGARRQRPSRAQVAKSVPNYQAAATLQGASAELLEFLTSCTVESVSSEFDQLMANEVSAQHDELSAHLEKEVNRQAADFFVSIENAECYEAAEAFVEATLRTRNLVADDDASTIAPDSDDEADDLADDDDEM